MNGIEFELEEIGNFEIQFNKSNEVEFEFEDKSWDNRIGIVNEEPVF